MSNLAWNYIHAGFLSEAEQLLNKALEIKDHHKNVDKAVGGLKDVPEDETKKEFAAYERAKPLSDYLRRFGRAVSRKMPTSVAAEHDHRL